MDVTRFVKEVAEELETEPGLIREIRVRPDELTVAVFELDGEGVRSVDPISGEVVVRHETLAASFNG